MRSVNTHVAACRQGIRRIRRYIPHLFTAITLHSVITAVSRYLTVWLSAQLIGELCREKQRDTLIAYAVLLLLSQLIFALAGGALKRMKEAKWERLYRCVNGMIDDKLLSLDHATFSDKRTRLHVAEVREHTLSLGRGLVELPETFQHLTNGIFGTAGAVVLCLLLPAQRVSTWLAFVTLFAVTAVAAVLCAALRKRSGNATDRILSLDRTYYALYDLAFDAEKAADVRLYRQDRLIDAHLRRTDRLFFQKGGLKHRPLIEWLDTVINGLPFIWAGVTWLAVAAGAANGALSPETAIGYAATVMLLTQHAASVRSGVENAKRNAPYLQTALAFFNIPQKMYRGSLTTEKRRDRDYTLTFDNVRFSYPSQSAPALRGVTVCLSPGKRIAIVGENGSGKSTFAKLLCRLYDPDDGAVLLNGIDVRKYRREDYVDLISAVFQDYRLFPCSLAENVSGRRDFDRDRVIRCLTAVGYPLGKDDVDGILYPDVASPADCQKIAIARALYKDAPFIILDEPTASLDPVAEAEIYARLDRIVEDRTAVFISHRLSSCRFCDEILVFDGGNVVQRGTHDELLAERNGKYYALWHAQAQYYQ